MTSKRKPTSDGVAILEQRYYSDAKRMADLEKARFHAKLAQVIYARRKALGLTQAQLAKRANTSVSQICRLEDADYDGHSLNTAIRVMAALKSRLEFRAVPLRMGMTPQTA
ncbi:MAG TPA: helix-turn-helix domain-containing protein [Candidatus Saccharimonadales bacterium]|nr:helix-turn-helix domain-containing protein [Candidatus Saccharimonadales bacterium]